MSPDTPPSTTDAAAPIADPRQIVLVTGMAGAGMSTVLKGLEDLGFTVVDNLPLPLVDPLVAQLEQIGRPLALGVDSRTVGFDPAIVSALITRLRAHPRVAASLLFLTAADERLIQRFSETRRRHPLAQDRPVAEGIAAERERLAPLRDVADLVIDSTSMSVPEARALISAQYAPDAPTLSVFVKSFSYKIGVPREADLVFDVRFLRNPHYVAELRPGTGRDADVAAYVEGDPGFPDFFASLTTLLGQVLPRYQVEGKSYLTIAIGCTGGRHRSVFVAERLTDWLSETDHPATLVHSNI